MTKGLPHKARAATVSRVHKSAMIGVAATALIAAAPAFSADATTMELQATIRSILHTALKDSSWREKAAGPRETPRLNAISIGNDDDIIVGADETALTQSDSVQDIDLVNTGNLTGGIGIEVSTGEINLADAVFDESMTYGWQDDWEFLYDDAGNPVLSPDGYQQQVATPMSPSNRAPRS